MIMNLPMPRGFRNNNPLNIRISSNPWQGKDIPSRDDQFETFSSMELGIRAALINLRTHLKQDKRKLVRTTVSREITRWAPTTENNTSGYIMAVCKKGNFQENEIISFSNKNVMCRLLWAMTYVENGHDLPFHLFERAYDLL